MPPDSVTLHRPAHLSGPDLSEIFRAAGVVERPWTDGPPAPGAEPALYLVDAASAPALAPVVTDPTRPVAVLTFASPPPGADARWFRLPADPEAARAVVTAALELTKARAHAAALTLRLSESEERIAALNRIGIDLSAERDIEKLLEKILTESRRFSRSEAGSLYLLEQGPEGKRLRFKLAQNDAVRFAFSERTIAVDDSSVAGFVAHYGDPLVLADAYTIPEGAPYSHNTAFDAASGWRTRAMLVVPMKDHTGDLVGVLQLMNRRGLEPGTFEPYPRDLVPLMLSLATQAAVSLKANQLTASIRKLFEDFARAAIVAVEQRDPTTAGHSNRVADLTGSLAKIVDRATEGPYASVRFSKEEVREIETAALLHDFGKVSIPEKVLVKARKLEDLELHRIRDRFDYVLESGDSADYRSLLHELKAQGRGPTPEDFHLLDLTRRERAEELEALFDEVKRANEPTILPEDVGGKLKLLVARTFRNRRGNVSPLLQDEEFRFLSIRKGSLALEERLQIESHVTQTYRFLSTIPWTGDLSRVPEIAYAHHEKLDGTGYPRRLVRADIPVPSLALTVCDIYDALTASDRPYKRAVPRERALTILEDEAKEGKLDSWMVSTFIAEKIWIPLA